MTRHMSKPEILPRGFYDRSPEIVGFRPKTVQVTPRIGIRKAADLPLRFLIGRTATKLPH
jgi:3-methyladenine DNA glycosylase Mpg